MATYTISKLRQSFIETHFLEWSLNKPGDFIPDKSLFENLCHPAELHYLAYIYNWDDGSLVLEWILESKLCTKSTANFLFWRAGPDYYLKCDLDDFNTCDSYNLDGFRVIRNVMEKYRLNNFSEYEIEFDPAGEIESILTKEPRWEIPEDMYSFIPGVNVELE